MAHGSRGHWLIWGDSEDKSDFLRTAVWNDLAAGLTQAIEHMTDADDAEAPGYPYYPAGDPREDAREAAQLAMIRGRDPDWIPPGSDSPGWMLVIHGATEDEARAKSVSLGQSVRGFLRLN